MIGDKHPTIICIEGVDGVGKETISKLLYEELSAIGKCLLISLPDYDTISGKLIYNILHNEKDYGWFNQMDPNFRSIIWTINRFDAYNKLNLTEDNDNIPYDYIIMDRSYFSNLIYQASEYYEMASRLDDEALFEFNLFNKVVSYMKTQFNIEYLHTFLRNIPLERFHIYYILNNDYTTQLKNRGGVLDHYEKEEAYLNNCNYFIRYLYEHKPNIFKYDVSLDPPFTEDIYQFYLQPLMLISAEHKDTPEDIKEETNRIAKEIMVDVLRGEY